VRSIVATSVAVGCGELSTDGVREALEARDRSASSGTAPPQGLTLMEVTYPDTNPGFMTPYMTS